MEKQEPSPLEVTLAEYASLFVQHEATQEEAQRTAEKFKRLESQLTKIEDRQDEVFKRLAGEAAAVPAGPTLYVSCGMIFRVTDGRVERLHAKEISPLPF